MTTPLDLTSRHPQEPAATGTGSARGSVRLGSAAAMIVLGLALLAEAPLPQRLPLGAERPQLVFHLLDGSPGPTWEQLAGKVVVVDFWATWCAPCVAAIPHMNQLRRDLQGEPIRIYSVTYEPAAKVREFLPQHPIETEIGIDDDLATFNHFVAWGIPISVVLDRHGKVVAVVSPTTLTAGALRDITAGKPVHLKEHSGWEDPAGAAKYFRELLEKDREKYEPGAAKNSGH